MSEPGDYAYEAAMDWYEDDLRRRASEHVERHGRFAPELVPSRRFGEEPEDIGPDEDLERAVRERIRGLRMKLFQRSSMRSGHRAPRRDRRLSSGRPRIRTSRRSSSSSTNARGDPDEPPPSRDTRLAPGVFPCGGAA